MRHESKGAQVGERRRGSREKIGGKVSLILEGQSLEGDADNVSRTGILFFTDGEVKVEVEYEEDGVLRRMRGQLVRCERIRGNRRGWAVEFEPPPQ
jgi:hypothetical protein